MSQRNVEVVRSAIESWNAGDWDGVIRDATDDVVIDNSTVQGEYRGVHRGPEQAKRLFERFVEPWESVRLEVVEAIDAGDRVFTWIRGHYRGRDGIEVQAQTGMCYTLEDGLITHIYMPDDVDSAREAAGLPLE